MGLVKSENKFKIGILGGTFDPAHKGHIRISKTAKKLFNLKKIIWAITKKNPFKNKSSLSLRQRINFAKKINIKNKFITVKFFEDKIKSNKTIDLLKYLKKNKSYELYFIIGADNLITFHKWKGFKDIIRISKILVFDRDGYKSKALKSSVYKKYHKKRVEFIKFNKVKISSSQLRKI